MGGDRELVMFSGLMAAILIFASQDWRALLVGFFFWFAGLWVLRLIAKSDPLMRDIYLRQLRYQSYYPARSRSFRKNPSSKGSGL
jgi:type IV secretion system protein VirB3